MKIELIPIKKLTLFEKNPRRITKDQMEKLCRSIQNDPEFLKCRPILVNCVTVGFPSKQILHVYAGNQRVRAAKKLGMKEIPCIVDYELDEETVIKRVVQDNAHHGEWDWDMLANEYDLDLLLECGFTTEGLLGSMQDIEEKVMCNTCPNCGGNLEET